MLLDAQLLTAGPTDVQLRLPADATQLGRAREFVRTTALRAGLDAGVVYEFVYAANEAVTNAIRHGAPDATGCIELSLTLQDEQLTLVVCDYGTFVAPEFRAREMTEGGRGFSLMASLTDDMRLTVEPGRTTLSLSKHFGAGGSGVAGDG